MIAAFFAKLAESLVIGGLVRLFYNPPHWMCRSEYDRGWGQGASSVAIAAVVFGLLAIGIYRARSARPNGPIRRIPRRPAP